MSDPLMLSLGCALGVATLGCGVSTLCYVYDKFIRETK
jgi:hypothetical protein